MSQITNLVSQNKQQDVPFNPNNKLLSYSDVEKILNRYGVHEKPKNLDIYRTSMVHRSYCCRKNENFNEGNQACPIGCVPLQEESSERLEHLGDSFIGTASTLYCYERFMGSENQGLLTTIRMKIVCGSSLAQLCEYTVLPEFFLISHQIDANNGRKNKKILEDTFEAFVGAMALDFHLRGMNALKICSTWLINLIEEHVDFTELILQDTNYKDKFLKYFQQAHGHQATFFDVNSENTSTGKHYEVCIKDKNMVVVGVGTGSSKKAAQNEACLDALRYFGQL